MVEEGKIHRMKNNFFEVLIYISIILSISLIPVNIYFTKYQIEKHSVHPVYGIYQQKVFGCDPWDSCKHCDLPGRRNSI